MHIHVALQPIIALVAGILILIRPRLLNYIVALYLIVVGVIGLLPILHLG
jgi:threonine/homoserine efflux transporter RhtA